MALSPEDLEQIRTAVRVELQQHPPGASAGRIISILVCGFVGLFLAVLTLHVLVIGGFTIYHLMHH